MSIQIAVETESVLESLPQKHLLYGDSGDYCLIHFGCARELVDVRIVLSRLSRRPYVSMYPLYCTFSMLRVSVISSSPK
jgi:hypothetical protein